MNLNVKHIICTLLAGSCVGELTAQQGSRGPTQTSWVAKTKGSVYIQPNKPLTKLADLKSAEWWIVQSGHRALGGYNFINTAGQ